MRNDIVAIVAQLNKEIDFLTKELLANINLTKMECVYLLYLSKNEGVNQYSIAKYYNTSRKLVATHIKSLETKGYLKKVENGRCKDLYLSKEGKKIVVEVIAKKKDLNAFLPVTNEDFNRIKEDLTNLISVFQNINNRDNLYRIE